MRRPVVVTGIGLVSSLGEGPDAHVRALRDGAAPVLETERFAPYSVHPAVKLDWDRQIPKKADQRQMEPWQKLGCYAAGLALEDAGLKEDADLKSRTQMIVAAGGGERDYAADGQILTGLRGATDPGPFLNDRLMSDLRPTLFLAQLSNMLAGNIAIVHGVTGASRTFMGEEASGTDALRIAEARIGAGQADIMLVGSSYNAERPDALVIFEFGQYLWRGPFRPVFARQPDGGGVILGSGGAFLVVEAQEHAAARGAVAKARLWPIASGRSRREPGAVRASLDKLWRTVGAGPAPRILSGASGAAGRTAEEHDALAALSPEARVTATGDLVGHPLEATAPMATALGAALLAAGDADEVVATAVGHRRGEGLVRLTRVG